MLSRITNDVDTLGQSLNQSVTQIITSVATLVGTLVMMISISGIMTLISLVILPVSAILISFIIKHSQKYFRQQQEYLGHINGQVEETYAGHTVIQAYNKEKDMVQQFQETIQQRVSGRRVCEKCGATYHIQFKPSKVEGVCDKCGAKTIIRKDDQPETVLDRLAVYHKTTEPLKAYYEKQGKLETVIGQEEVADTTALVLKAVGVK